MEILNKYKFLPKAIVAALIIIGVIISQIALNPKDDVVVEEDKIKIAEETSSSSSSSEEENNELTPSQLIIDVSGAVKKPSIYILPSDSRVYQVIEMAGGLTPDAETKDINLAAKLVDGSKLYVPTKSEVESGGRIPQVIDMSTTAGDGKININTSTQSELEEITGIGPAMAERIIEYREENGQFNSVDDLSNVTGIGPKKLEKMRDEVTV